MSAILSVAATTFRESIRNRTVLGIVLLALAFILSALLLAELSLDQRTRVIKDWGLFCVSIFGVMLAILMGVSLVHKEVRRKTLYVILSRPIHRYQYVLGKYFGLASTLLVEVGALSAALIILLAFERITPDALMLKALFLSLIEILLLAALAVFFASFTSPYLSGLFTLGLFVVGRSLPALNTLADRTSPAVFRAFLKGLVYILPDLADFNLSTRAVHGLEIPVSDVLNMTLYGIGYLSLLLFAASWVFSKRDLT
jgi:ABC-type transport system involved in multi-copper enzyme maturation permease subunit